MNFKIMNSTDPDSTGGHSKPRLTCSLALVVSTVFGGSLVGAEKFSVNQWIKTYDRTGDGKIDRDEFTGGYDFFAALDANRDKLLDKKELSKKGVPELLAEAASMRNMKLVTLDDRKGVVDIASFDGNADGQISPREFDQYLFALADQDSDADINLFEAKYIAQWSTFAGAFKTATEVLQRFDRNKDGLIVPKEWKTDRTEFNLRDKNNNGQLAADELESRINEKSLHPVSNLNPDVIIEKFDKNGNGKLERSEIPGGSQGNFGRVDRDDDGEVSRDELGLILGYQAKNQMSAISSDFIRRFDFNRDGRVHHSEFPGADSVFKRMDRNGDGSVSKGDSSR